MLWANILDYAEPENRDGEQTWFAVDPDRIYPAVLEHFRQCRIEGTPPHPKSLDRYYLEAAFLPAPALALAKKPYGSLTDTRERLVHDQALEIARLWFCAAIQEVVPGPTGIHILRRPSWRLYYV